MSGSSTHAGAADHLCRAQADEWRLLLESAGFDVSCELNAGDGSGTVSLDAQRGATRLELRASVKLAEHGPEWTVKAPLFRGTTCVAVIRTPLLLQRERLLELVSRLERMDPANPKMRFGPASWSSRMRPSPPPVGGIAIARVRGNSTTDELLATLARTASVLYSMVAAAQGTEPSTVAQDNAQYEVVVATAAIAAAELESFVHLVSLGLDAPAMVHARSVGALATRIAIYRQHPQIAHEVYESFPASIVELLNRFGDDDRPLPAVTDGVPLHSMRAIERRSSYTGIRNEIAAKEHLLSLAEQEAMSKRAHGDVTSLAQVAASLASRSPDVRAAIVRSVVVEGDNEITVRSSLVRVLGYALHLGVDLQQIASLDTEGTLESLASELDHWRHHIDD